MSSGQRMETYDTAKSFKAKIHKFTITSKL